MAATTPRSAKSPSAAAADAGTRPTSALPLHHPENGVPGPGAYYDVYPSFGQSRSAPASPHTSWEDRPKPKPRGITRLPASIAAGGMTVHGALPDSDALMRHRHAARAAGVHAIRSAGRKRAAVVHTGGVGVGVGSGVGVGGGVSVGGGGGVDAAAWLPSDGTSRATSARALHLARWMEGECGITPSDSHPYAHLLVALGCDSPADVADLEPEDLPQIKLLHRRRILGVAKGGDGGTHGASVTLS